jgi:hypothetical protein
MSEQILPRRAALGLFAGLPALVAMPAIARASSPSLASAEEAELFALQAEIADADKAFDEASAVCSAAEDVFYAAAPPKPRAPVGDVTGEEWFKAMQAKLAADRSIGPTSERIAYEAAVKERERLCESLKMECGLEAAERRQSKTQ